MHKYYNVYVWQWILFFIAIAILIVVLLMYFTAPRLMNYVDNYRNTLQWITVPKLMDQVSTGDVILMEGDSYGERVMKWCTRSIFSHVALVIRVKKYEESSPDQEEIVYLWESDLGQKKKAGPRLIPLKEKLKLYKGSKIAAWRPLKSTSSAKKPSPEDFISIVKKYLEYDMDHRVLTWWFAGWWNWAYSLFKTDNKMFCSELVASTLQEIGILKKDRQPAWYCPGDWAKQTPRLALENGYSYGPIQFFDFSSDVE